MNGCVGSKEPTLWFKVAVDIISRNLSPPKHISWVNFVLFSRISP